MDSPIQYNRIKTVLHEMGLRQNDLIEYINESKDTISRWCRNKNNPSLPDLYKIAQVLRIDIRRLIEPTIWKDDPTETPPVEIIKRNKAKAKQKRAIKKKGKK